MEGVFSCVFSFLLFSIRYHASTFWIFLPSSKKNKNYIISKKKNGGKGARQTSKDSKLEYTTCDVGKDSDLNLQDCLKKERSSIHIADSDFFKVHEGIRYPWVENITAAPAATTAAPGSATTAAPAATTAAPAGGVAAGNTATIGFASVVLAVFAAVGL